MFLALLFFGVVTPTAWIMRAMGKDLLGLRRDPQAASYWVHRQPPGPDANTMHRQF